MSSINFISTAIIATAVGVTLGVLFAPQQGYKTRRDISKKKHEYTDYLSDSFDSFVDSASDKMNKAEHKADRFVDKSSDKINEVASQINSK